jgi:type I restriction enzyme S subunit
MGASIKTRSQYLARAGRFIYSRIDARNGAMGIVPNDLDGAILTGDFRTFDFDLSLVEPDFFEYVTKTKWFEEKCRAPSRGVSNRKRLKEPEFLAIQIPLPPLPDQRQIASRINQIASRVREARQLSEEIEKGQMALLLRGVKEISKDSSRAPMAEVAPVVRRPVEVEPDEWYPELGIRSFGKGTFHKEAIKGSELGGKRIYRIEPGDLLFSNVFSWEGAIAVVQPQDKGRFGSHRFITCVPDPERATPEFLCYYFLTGQGLTDIRAASPGAAGRNKTLGIVKLESIKVPLPPLDVQNQFGELLKRVQRARNIRQQTSIYLDHLLPAVLDKAFQGELLKGHKK